MNKLAVVAILGVIAVLVGGWLIYKRRFLALKICIVLGVVAVGAYGWREFQQRYPNEKIFSLHSYSEALSIILGRDIPLTTFAPRSVLKVERETIERAAYPVIDIHFHLESLPPDITPELLIKGMDAAGVAQIVNLGGLPGVFEKLNEKFKSKYPDRIILFARPDIAAVRREGGIAEQVRWIDKAASMGARGLKFTKSFGLGHRDTNGKLITVDDIRYAPIFDEAARLGLPVLIHTGDPTAFFEAPDRHNERYAELLQFPEWSYFQKPGFPTKEEMMAARERLFTRHPKTTFIGAHLGMNDDDLAYAAYMLDTYPNYNVDMSSVVHSLGRQPYTARRFFIRYQDRILFGTDGGYKQAAGGDGWTAERMYRSYFEFLETENDYIDYPMSDITKQGYWRVYGLNLPPEVLEKIYFRNAQRLMPSEADIKARAAATTAADGTTP
jgi:predicted TIM-barrel fold metal-dependent hydrolase